VAIMQLPPDGPKFANAIKLKVQWTNASQSVQEIELLRSMMPARLIVQQAYRGFLKHPSRAMLKTGR